MMGQGGGLTLGCRHPGGLQHKVGKDMGEQQGGEGLGHEAACTQSAFG